MQGTLGLLTQHAHSQEVVEAVKALAIGHQEAPFPPALRWAALQCLPHACTDLAEVRRRDYESSGISKVMKSQLHTWTQK